MISLPPNVGEARASSFRATGAIVDTVGGVVGTMKNMVENPWVVDAPSVLDQHHSLEFDGVDDYVLLSGSGVAFSGEFTFSAWLNFNTISINAIALGGATGVEYALILYGANAGIRTDSTTVNVAHGLTISTGTWYHLAITRDGSNDLEYYIDGVSVGTASGHTGTNTVKSIGAYDDGDKPFIGKLANIMLYDAEKNAAEVALIAGGKIDTADLVARWKLDGN